MKRLWYGAAAIIIVLWMAGAAAFLLEARNSIVKADERDYGEGIVLWQAAHVTDLKSAYHSVDKYPYIVFHYPPLYHVLSRIAAVFTGDLLAAGRLVSSLAFTAIGIMLASLVWRCLRVCRHPLARVFGALCAGLLIFSMSVSPWGYLMRVDATAIALTLGGLCLYISAKHRPAMAFSAFTLFVAALYTKQTMIAAPLVCLVLAWIERPKLALRLLGWSMCLGMAVLLVMNRHTNGYFVTNLFSYNRNPFTIGQLIGSWTTHMARVFVIPMTAASLVAISAMTGTTRKFGMSYLTYLRRCLGKGLLRRCAVLTSGWLVIALLMTLTAGKEGSNINYFMEVDVAVTLLAALFLGWTTERALRNAQEYPLILSVSMAAFFLQAAPAVGSAVHAVSDLSAPERDSAVTAFVRHLPGRVYSENMTILMETGKEVAGEPAIVTCLSKASAWDESKLVGQITGGQFAGIVVNTSLDNRERFSLGVATAIRDTYRKYVRFGENTVYLPADSPLAAYQARR